MCLCTALPLCEEQLKGVSRRRDWRLTERIEPATMSAKNATMSAEDATMCAKGATMSAKDAKMTAKDATMCTKDATMTAKDASKAAASAGGPRPCAGWLRQSRRQVGETEAPAKCTGHREVTPEVTPEGPRSLHFRGKRPVPRFQKS